MKIQINSLEALERLIGGDTDVEIEIRNSIVQEFAKNHLKAVVASASVDSWVNSFKKQLAEIVARQCYDKLGSVDWRGTVTISPQIKSELTSKADAAARAAVSEAVTAATEKVTNHFTPERLEALIDKRADALLSYSIDERVNQRLNEIMKAATAAATNSGYALSYT